ncbi:MAG TPA: hypothetical protein PLD55_13160 [bacterium]|nr:hypothetical protein [Bacilli bacterium]HQM85622.1 hypothetical protein [bacterium]
MPKTNKQTDEIIKQRITKLLPMVSFMTRGEIFQYVSSKENWGITQRQLDNYIAKAKELLKSEFQAYKDDAYENAWNNYIMLFKKAMKKDDTKLCLQIQDSMAKLFGLTQKLDLTSAGEKITGFTVKVSDDDE